MRGVLDAMIRYGVSLSRSVELTAQWDKILALGPLHPVTLDDFSFDQGMGIGAFFHAASVSIVVSVTSFMRLWFTVGTRLFAGGGIGDVRIPLCILTSGSGLIWCPLLHFYIVSLILPPVVLGCLLIRPGSTRNSGRPGFPTFVALGKGRFLPELTGEVLAEVVLRKGATAGGLDGLGLEGVEGSAGVLV